MDTAQTKEYIIKNLKLERLLPDEQDSVIQKLESNIADKAFIYILDTLEPNEQEELHTLSTTNPDKVNEYLETKIPNIRGIIESVAKEIVEDFKKRVNMLEQ